MGEAIEDGWLVALEQVAGGRLPVRDADSTERPLAWARRVGIDEAAIAEATARHLDVPYCTSLKDYRPSAKFVEKYPIDFAREHAVLLLIGQADQLHLAMPSPDVWHQLDVARRLFRREVLPLFAPREEILRAISLAYEQQATSANTVIADLSTGGKETNGSIGLEDLLATHGRGSAVELVNRILLDAVKAGASDVHFQPYRHKLIVRLRIDGVLFDSYDVPKQIQEEVLSRIKVIGKMNIAEKRLPQDGRATVTVGERLIDLRIASLPGSYGERIVLRLLDKSARLYTLSEVGMDRLTYERFRELIALEHGLILLTGPTGSGKSTTLYAALQEINTKDRNVITLEDPIEYDIEGISQTQINVKKGLTFASGLRNVLRQDPDIIMVGEIRDQETAVMAIQSALTGHLVFSTLHTNDAASAVTRLLDLGIEPYLVSSSLLAVLAQRLVRKVCRKCAEEVEMDEESAKRLDSALAGKTMSRGRGCAACRETGYAGRIAITELLLVDEQIRQKIQAQATASEMRDVAIESGMRLLREDGVAKVLAGITTPEEVERVTVRTEM